MSRTNSDQEQLFRGANPNVLAADPSEDPSGSDASFGEAGLAFDAKQAAGDSTLGFGSDSAASSEYSLSMSAGDGGGFGGSAMPNIGIGGGMGGGGIPGGGGMGGMQGMAQAQSRFSGNEVADQGKQELTAPATDAFPRELNLGLGGKLSKNKDSVENTEEKLGELDDRSLRSRSIPQQPTLGNDVAPWINRAPCRESQKPFLIQMESPHQPCPTKCKVLETFQAESLAFISQRNQPRRTLKTLARIQQPLPDEVGSE